RGGGPADPSGRPLPARGEGVLPGRAVAPGAGAPPADVSAGGGGQRRGAEPAAGSAVPQRGAAPGRVCGGQPPGGDRVAAGGDPPAGGSPLRGRLADPAPAFPIAPSAGGT